MWDMIVELFIALMAGFLIALFAFTGSVKLFRWHKGLAEFQLGFMRKYGLNEVLYSLIGFAELSGAIGLISLGSNYIGTFAAGGLCLLSFAAFCFHLKFDSFQFGMPALMTGSASGTIVLYSYQSWAEFPFSIALFSDASLALIGSALVGGYGAFKFSQAMRKLAAEQLASEDPYRV